MPARFNRVYIQSAGYHLPGEPVDNQEMDDFIAPLNRISLRIKNKILAENGIQTRHYAIDKNGETKTSHTKLAANAIHDCLARANTTLNDVSLLAVGSSGSDA